MQISVAGSGRRPPTEAGFADTQPPALLSLKRGALPLKQSNQEPRWVRWVGRRAAPAQKTHLTPALESLTKSALSQCLSRCARSGRGRHRRDSRKPNNGEWAAPRCGVGVEGLVATGRGGTRVCGHHAWMSPLGLLSPTSISVGRGRQLGPRASSPLSECTGTWPLSPESL